MTRSPPRALYAAGLLAAALAVLLVAWFLAGWSEVRARQHTERSAPEQLAEQRGVALAQELRGELTRLMTRELERPYFHYQNLFRDPRASRGTGVVPSPLATGPEDPLVLGYFQLDTRGRATTPTINDDLPDLSEPKHLAANRQFRDEVVRSLSAQLAPATRGATVVAEATRPPTKTKTVRRPPQSQARQETEQQAQVIKIDRSAYTQNVISNQIYLENMPQAQAQEQVQEQPPEKAPPPKPRIAAPIVKEQAPPPAEPVTIIVSPLEWRTYAFGGVPSLLAVRQVETPDGTLAQGFVVDRATLTSWLAARATDSVAELVPGDNAATEVAPGWQLVVRANPRVLARAAADAAKLATSFIVKFILIGVIALLAAALVVMLVARAEKLAQERSQFAAAAAHELRTPLAGLQLYGDMLADGLGDPAKQRDYARRMSEEASRLGRVVSNVLGFSQLERGNLSVEPAIGLLGDELRQLAERAEPALDRAGAVLALDVAPELTARFDRDALARIVGNLLDNAEKYGRDAEDRTISLAARDVGDAIEVTVSDHGPGITAQARARLFRPFSRGVPSDGPAGLGLGLALSQSLARAMGGDLEYRASPGGGATFVLTLARA